MSRLLLYHKRFHDWFLALKGGESSVVVVVPGLSQETTASQLREYMRLLGLLEANSTVLQTPLSAWIKANRRHMGVEIVANVVMVTCNHAACIVVNESVKKTAAPPPDAAAGIYFLSELTHEQIKLAAHSLFQHMPTALPKQPLIFLRTVGPAESESADLAFDLDCGVYYDRERQELVLSK